jgi:hypothetical protein
VRDVGKRDGGSAERRGETGEWERAEGRGERGEGRGERGEGRGERGEGGMGAAYGLSLGAGNPLAELAVDGGGRAAANAALVVVELKHGELKKKAR